MIETGSTYTETRGSDARLPTDPTISLTLREIEDLRWFWQDAEALCGVRSTFGAQLEQARGKMASDDVVRELAAIKREVTALRRKAGLQPLPEEQTMYVNEDTNPPLADPFDNDDILLHVRRANVVRRRLEQMPPWHRVLHAVYGPGRGDENDRRAIGKRFGEIGEVVIAVVASQRTEEDPPARAIVIAKLTDDSFVRMMRHVAGNYVRQACERYARTR